MGLAWLVGFMEISMIGSVIHKEKAYSITQVLLNRLGCSIY